MNYRSHADIKAGFDKVMSGPCAKTHVTCEIITPGGGRFTGSNWCANPQEVCPRTEGEGYEKCKSICKQSGHAEIDALAKSGDQARGATAVLRGHSYVCQNCQEALFAAGIETIAVRSGSTKETEESENPECMDNDDLEPWCYDCGSTNQDDLIEQLGVWACEECLSR